MTKKTGLGKGLDALLINNVVEEEKVHEGEVVQKLKLIEVEPNRDQPRRNFDEEAIEDLSNSIKEYGVITGYVYPLLLLPSFFTMAISTSLLPIISSSYAKGLYKYAKKKLKQAIYISLGIGVFCTCFFMTIPDILLNFIYNTNLGINYIKIIAPFFILHYIQGPLTSYLQAIDKSNIAMYGTLVGAIIKNILLIILPLFIGFNGFIISSLINIIYVTVHHIYHVKKS